MEADHIEGPRAPAAIEAERTLVLLVVAFVVGVLLARLAPGTGAPVALGDHVPNPLVEAFDAVASREGLDLGFARRVRPVTAPVPLAEHPLFAAPARSFDVLILGDSTVAYGLIPQVVAQRSGLRVATFGVPATALGPENVRIYRRVVEHALAEDGLLLLMFSQWSQSKRITEASMGALHALDDAFFAELAQRRGVRAQPYAAWTARRQSWSAWLRGSLGLALPDRSFYGAWLEPILNPAWSRQKAALRTGGLGERFAWDDWTQTLFEPRPRKWSRASTAPPARLREVWRAEKLGWAARRADAARSLPGRKRYVLPWYAEDQEYAVARGLHAELYAEMPLVDLGRLHDEAVRHPLTGRAHLANAAGLEASLAIGRWLERSGRR